MTAVLAQSSLRALEFLLVAFSVTSCAAEETSREDAARPAAATSRVQQAQDELRVLIDASLDGEFHVDDLLDQVLVFASLPVSAELDPAYEDDDETIPHRIEGTPAGTRAHFFIGIQPNVHDGRDFQFFQMEIQMDADQPAVFHRDALREGPRIHLTLDHDFKSKPGSFGLLTERKVALRDSKRAGIDAYHGRFRSGASYAVGFGDPSFRHAVTFDILDGNYVGAGGETALHGDLDVDPSKVAALVDLFREHQREILEKKLQD